ncbi:hypothetical protein MMC09_004626 [Bachmanniomyces sp. S44760]|nr:hypothetical protein [Bachmanniomyces sp. S44760]
MDPPSPSAEEEEDDTNSEISNPPEIPDWELELGLPQFSDPFIQKYLDGRDALIEQEKTSRSDSSFRARLTPLAAEACAIVSRIRAREHRTLWRTATHGDTGSDAEVGREGEGHGSDDGAFAGMPFHLSRERMQTSKLWGIVRRMPKGALLHAHFDAMISLDWLIERVLETEGMAIRADGDLSSGRKREGDTGISFQFVKSGLKQEGAAAAEIWSPGYEKGSYVAVGGAADAFPEGGRDGFKKWLMGRCSITMEESLDYRKGIDEIWGKFTSIFPIIGSMIFYEPIFRAAIQMFLHELVADGIRWVDFRLSFVFQYWRAGAERGEKGYAEMFKVFAEEVKKFQGGEDGRGFWGCRFIWTGLRRLDKRGIIDDMLECIAMKKAFPDLISGYDLVGQEDAGRPLKELVPELFWFKKRCMEEGVDVPFYFHAGECLGDGDSTDQNLFDAILLGTRRIGHGFSLYKHPLLIEMVKQKGILVECCPISNEILRLTHSILSHPLPALLARGVSVALCNDDPAILGHTQNGSTHDFWQALHGWENVGLAGLGSIAEDSVKYAAYTPDQSTREWIKDIKDGLHGQGVRGERMREWRKEWEDFCAWIVMNYAGDYGSDNEDDDLVSK